MTIIDALLGEHGALLAQLDRLEADLGSEGSGARVREQAALLAAALLTHAELEDQLLFNRMAEAGADVALVAAMTSDHEQIAALLAVAQGSADTARAAESALEAIALARVHFAREERVAFPLARTLLGPKVLAELGQRWAERRAVWLEVAP